MNSAAWTIPATLAGRGNRLPDAVDEKIASTAAFDVAALTAAVSQGDAAAVEAFYRKYFDRLYAEARRATRRDEAFCLDVVHDAVLKIVRNIRPVRSEPQLLGWMKLVVRTAALDALRSEKRRQKREATAALNPQGETTTNVEQGEQIEWLRRQIAQLDPEIVRLIELRFIRQWTLARIATGLGLSVGTIDGRLRRALAGLRNAAAEVHDA